MEIKNNLKLNQSQRITINLQMQESLQILQLSYSEMIKKINKELEKNPLLEPELKKQKKNLYNSKLYLNSKENNSKSKYIENTLEQKKNLRDHVNEQLNIDIKNNEIERLSKVALKNSHDYSTWWAVGGVIAGIALTIAVVYAVEEVK